MSKNHPWSLKKKIIVFTSLFLSIGALVGALVMVAPFVILALGFHAIDSDYNKVVTASKNNFSSINMPTEFALQSSRKGGDPVDVPLEDAGYDYTYSYSSDKATATTDLTNTLQRAGYTVTTTSTGLAAQNDTKNSKITADFSQSGAVTIYSMEIRV